MERSRDTLGGARKVCCEITRTSGMHRVGRALVQSFNKSNHVKGKVKYK